MGTVEQHLKWMQLRGLRPTTLETRKRLLVRVEQHIGKPLLDATYDDIAAWRASLHQSAGTVCALISGVHSFFKWALAEDLVEADPTTRVVSPKKPRRLPRPIPRDELVLALATADARIKPWLVLASYCGLRAREIAFLRAEDLTLTGPSPYIAVSAEAGKGSKPRVVPLGQVPLAALRVHGVPARGYVFPRFDGQPGANMPWTISERCNDHLHGLGITSSLHALRHAYASSMYALSHDLRMVQEVLGHADPATTSLYVAYSKAAAFEAARALDVA